MRIVAVNPGHDGAVAALDGNELLFCLESEKDSFPRHQVLTPMTQFALAEYLDGVPDVIALGGWGKLFGVAHDRVGSGYFGSAALSRRRTKLFGKEVTFFSSSHERSHIMGALGMAPRIDDVPVRAVLVWEGQLGNFYLVDESWSITREVPVLNQPGSRYAFLFNLADPTFPDEGQLVKAVDAGKLMALAAYGNPEDADRETIETIKQIIETPNIMVGPKKDFRDSPLYNVGVEAEVHKTAAARLTRNIFDIFAIVAEQRLPSGIPLYVSGGCGLNCDWNSMWRESGQFSSVFVPPCPNDSGSAIGTAIDALTVETGDPHIEWNVYSGLEFDWDHEPDSSRWIRRDLDLNALVDALTAGDVAAWVQGRWEIGPRALGNRSLLAEPFNPATRDRLNEIKQREGYRPVAPCCRLEDARKIFDSGFEDPYMLYFRRVRADGLGAVTHVDGSARPQTVTKESNRRLYELLCRFADVHGLGVLCNTSLNYKGAGFINRLSDLAKYCEARGVSQMVVGDTWFTRRPA